MVLHTRPNVLVFASGKKSTLGGGSGFLELVEASRTDPPILEANIVGVVSNHAHGGVSTKALEARVPFFHWAGPFTAQGYQELVEKTCADYVMLSGWLYYVKGLRAERTINIHPGPLPLSGGLYGHRVHEFVLQKYLAQEITQTAVTMHFVTDDTPYDTGPVLFEFPVPIRSYDTPETLGDRVNEKERAWQAYVLNLVAHGQIWLEGKRVCYGKGLYFPFRQKRCQ